LCAKINFADINVFIGARYNTTVNRWLWSDGSNAPFPSDGFNKCQQKAWKYGEVWCLTNVDCDADKAKYMCELRGISKKGLYSFISEETFSNTFLQMFLILLWFEEPAILQLLTWNGILDWNNLLMQLMG